MRIQLLIGTIALIAFTLTVLATPTSANWPTTSQPSVSGTTMPTTTYSSGITVPTTTYNTGMAMPTTTYSTGTMTPTTAYSNPQLNQPVPPQVLSWTPGSSVPASTYLYTNSKTTPYTTYGQYTPGQTGPIYNTPATEPKSYQYGWMEGLSHGLSASQGYDLGYALGGKATSYNPPKCQLSSEYCDALQRGYTNAYYSAIEPAMLGGSYRTTPPGNTPIRWAK